MAKTCCDIPLPAGLKGDVDDALATLCKALAHPVRVRLLRMLCSRGECISGDLAGEFELAQSTVSEHLRILKEAGLVQGTIDGQRRCYCIHPAVLGLMKKLVAEL
jgi:ArsR family transcriptional regulator